MKPVYRRRAWVSISATVTLGLLGLLALASEPVSDKSDSTHKGEAPRTPFQWVTGSDADEVRGHWDEIFNSEHYVFGREPADILKTQIHLLPVGRALDIATGEGRNAVYLAKKGFVVEGVDISEVALRKARRLAKDQRVQIKTINADLRQYQIKPNHYDLILDIQFLERALISQIRRGLRKNGVVVFQNFTLEQLKNPGGVSLPRNLLLGPGELKDLFKDFEILYYQETNDGKEALATLIGKKK